MGLLVRCSEDVPYGPACVHNLSVLEVFVALLCETWLYAVRILPFAARTRFFALGVLRSPSHQESSARPVFPSSSRCELFALGSTERLRGAHPALLFCLPNPRAPGNVSPAALVHRDRRSVGANRSRNQRGRVNVHCAQAGCVVLARHRSRCRSGKTHRSEAGFPKWKNTQGVQHPTPAVPCSCSMTTVG